MKQGYDVQTGISTGFDGKPVSLIRISNQTRWVTIADMPQTEHLVPTYIAYLDRRLGLKSPWFSIDPTDPAYI
jgi:hypothetical protein